MSIEVKSILSVILLAAGFTAAYSMFYLMGKSDEASNTSLARGIHRAAGFVFLALAVVVSYFCVTLLAGYEGELTPIAALHMFSALALLVVLAIKLSIVHFYRGLLKLAPALGITILALAFVTVGTSAGYYGIKALKNPEVGTATRVSSADSTVSDSVSTDSTAARSSYVGVPERGAAIFASRCSSCHNVSSGEEGWGPSLMGLFKMRKLPTSGKPVSEKNVINQILNPAGSMPAFDNLSEEDLKDLLSYLKSI